MVIFPAEIKSGLTLKETLNPQPQIPLSLALTGYEANLRLMITEERRGMGEILKIRED